VSYNEKNCWLLRPRIRAVQLKQTLVGLHHPVRSIQVPGRPQGWWQNGHFPPLEIWTKNQTFIENVK